MKTATRLLALPVIYLCAWWSFWQWLFRLITGKKFDDRDRFVNFFGWNDPAMEKHWQRFWARLLGRRYKLAPGEGVPGDWKHAAKNVLVEKDRLSAERSAKLRAWLVVNLVLTNLTTAAALIF